MEKMKLKNVKKKIRKYKNNQQQHTTNEKVYQQIPYDINRLNKSDLRRRIADY